MHNTGAYLYNLLYIISSSMEDGEKQDKAKEIQSEHLEEGKMKKKKRRRGQKIEKPEAVMANFVKALEVYQTKMLVSFIPILFTLQGN